MNPMSALTPRTADDVMAIGPVIPVITITRIEDAVPLARALIAGGIRALEVTLRTPVALDAVAAMRGVAGAIIGAGTVLNAQDAARAAGAGAQFIVSPGLTEGLAKAVKGLGLPFLPGIATPADIMRGLDLGLDRFKFFPAEVYGGANGLKAFAGPFPQIRFCPTGGVTPATAPDYLALPNVGCVGGTWLTPKSAMEAGDWAKITALAAQASALRS
jgi:2-dehydro-3-deoxyphosphogluconate aldolase / (4S)-4-hydroxy-2-oxoglutarate aldolase